MASNGFKLKDSNGIEVSIFPSQEVNITQGAYSGYSHEGSLNTDNACISSRRDIYAPFKMKVYANFSSAGYGIVYFHTVNPVRFPNGTVGHGTIVMMHDNNASRWTVGRVFEQGDLCYTEGKADPSGWTTGIHVHYEVAFGHQTSRVAIPGNSGGFSQIVNAVRIDTFFYMNGCVYRNEVPPSGMGQRTNFKTYEEQQVNANLTLSANQNDEVVEIDLGVTYNTYFAANSLLLTFNENTVFSYGSFNNGFTQRVLVDVSNYESGTYEIVLTARINNTNYIKSIMVSIEIEEDIIPLITTKTLKGVFP